MFRIELAQLASQRSMGSPARTWSGIEQSHQSECPARCEPDRGGAATRPIRRPFPRPQRLRPWTARERKHIPRRDLCILEELVGVLAKSTQGSRWRDARCSRTSRQRTGRGGDKATTASSRHVRDLSATDSMSSSTARPTRRQPCPRVCASSRGTKWSNRELAQDVRVRARSRQSAVLRCPGSLRGCVSMSATCVVPEPSQNASFVAAGPASLGRKPLTAFLRRNGSQLLLDGSPVRLAGPNIYWSAREVDRIA